MTAADTPARRVPAGREASTGDPAAASPHPTIQYAVCALSDIPNRRARAFQLLRRAAGDIPKAWSIFIVRWGNQAFGYVNVCPHHGVNLDWERNRFLDPNGRHIMCGKHGALFEIGTGRCVEGPCAGGRLEPVAVTVIDGDVCVSGIDLIEDDRQAAAS